MRALSGIQPSGALHLGNYFAAIKQYIDLQEEHEGFYFIANYHALTTIRDPDTLRANCIDLAMDFLALGLDPARSTLFVQSDIPEVFELTWLLSTVTPMGLLERCHAYKEKVAEGIPADHGLFAYPVLMAADILIYGSDVVPVGGDQKQHVEVTRDIAIKFNNTFGETFVIPEPVIDENLAVVPGLDGQKMSKSYGNTIPIFQNQKTLKKQVMAIVTDATPVEEPKDPSTCNLYAIYKLFAQADRLAEVHSLYVNGGAMYGKIKLELVDLIWEFFRTAREKRERLENDRPYVHEVLAQGAAKAREKAVATLDLVKERTGLKY
jgi:tryptophanyl-tRNA synthetase